jgi:predicted transcriptional regulator
MDPVFTDRELDIMHVLWGAGSGTAAEVRTLLADSLAYNTVLTMLGILEQKGYARHKEAGRAFRYYPTVARRTATTSALRRLTKRLFDGDPRLLVAALVSDRALSEQDLRALKELLDQRVREGRGKP